MTLTKYKDYQELFNGITAYWDGSLTSDGKLQDLISGYHGTFHGATKNVVNRFGINNTGIYFNSDESDYIDLPSISLTQCPTTIICWVRHPTIITSNPGTTEAWVIFCFVYGSSDLQCGFRIGDASTYNKVAMRKFNGTSGILLEPNIPINTSDYYFIACRYNADHTMDLFINDVKTHSSNTDVANAALTQTNALGSWTWAPYMKTNFYLDNLSLFKGVALSDDIIKMIYHVSKNQYLYPLIDGERGVE